MDTSASAIILGSAVLSGLLIDTASMILPISVAPDWAKRSELGWFVMGAFGGLVGIELINRVARATFAPVLGNKPT